MYKEDGITVALKATSTSPVRIILLFVSLGFP
jgi:hypothetical protein